MKKTVIFALIIITAMYTVIGGSVSYAGDDDGILGAYEDNDDLLEAYEDDESILEGYEGDESILEGYEGDESILEGYEPVAGTSVLSLYINGETHAIAVKDKRNGYIWTSALDERLYDEEKLNDFWKSYVKSLMVIKYAQIDNVKTAVQVTTSEGAESTFNWRKTGNKLIVDYYFTEIKIGITLEFEISGDELIVRIPNEKIREDGVNGIISIELLPFFGAANRSVDGYILYPDGCGALLLYDNVENKPKSTVKYTYYAYGSETVDINSKIYYEDQRYQAMLPIYGVKNGENAFIGISSDGDSDVQINLSVEGYMVDFNRIAFEYTYRHLFEIVLSNVRVNLDDVLNSSKGIKVDKKLDPHESETRYVFLYGEDASYSGMANAYRDYLIESGGIKKVIKDGDSIPLAVDFLMGIEEDRLLFDKFITMTNFKQVKNITQMFIDSGIENLQVKLFGWASGGYGKYPVNWPPDRRVGGIGGLKEYSAYAKENNIDLFMQVNFIDAIRGSGGFSKRNDVVYQGNTMPLTDYNESWYLLNPSASYSMYKDFMKSFLKYSGTGVAFEEIGQIIYHDYNKRGPSVRMQTMEKWEEMLEDASQKCKVAVEGGNAYVLKYADRLFKIPIESSQFIIMDREVPFYQMVVHGLIPYTCDAGNLFYDPAKQKLKWIEYGCMPYYELTYQKSREIKFTEYNQLFTSHYDEWVENATGIYKEFNERLGGIWSKYMTGHEIISGDLVKVSYSDGTVIIINYKDRDVIHDGHTIKAQDYIVLKGGK